MAMISVILCVLLLVDLNHKGPAVVLGQSEPSNGSISQPDIPLYFSLILSFGEFGFNSSGEVPAVNIALEEIYRANVLPGYRLQYKSVRNSKCDRGAALDAFFGDFQSDPVKIALIGCGCSVATEPVAEISHRWNVSQISPASASSTLSDRSRFANYFRTDPTFEIFAPAVLSLLEHYGWERIAFLTQDENLFRNLYSDVKVLAQSVASNNSEVCCFSPRNITVENRLFATDTNDPIPAIHNVLDDDYRVFFINSYSVFTRKIVCEVLRRNLTYPSYVWITHGWYPNKWWTQAVANDNIPCSDIELEEFLYSSRMLTINHLPVIDDIHAVTEVTLTTQRFLSRYDESATAGNYLQTVKSTLGYDATWALALALNKTKEMVELNDFNVTGCEGSNNHLQSLENFEYSNGLMGCIIRYNLIQTDFVGVSSQVQFDESGSRVQDKIRLHQYRRNGRSTGLEAVTAGFTRGRTGFTFTYSLAENDKSVFSDGIPPDGTPQMITHTYHVALVIVYYVIAAVGIVFSKTCAIFNLFFRKRKVVRLTSPNLNYILIGGVIVMYASVYIGVLPVTSDTAVRVQCYIHSWLYVIGYLTAFGTILSKMWRVYHIFHNPTPNKKTIKDWQLGIVVLAITLIGLVLVIIRTAAQTTPPQLMRDNENPEGLTDLGVREEYFVWECYTPASGPFYCDLLIYVYLIILQIVGIVLAFQTRKVKISALNDSKFIAAIVYISTIVLVILVLLTFSLRGYINVEAAIFNGGIIVMATVFVSLTFIPKMVNLYQDPLGEKIFDKKGNGSTSDTLETGISRFGDSEMISSLKSKVNEQESMIKDKSSKIQELEETIAAMHFQGNTKSDVIPVVRRQ